MPFFDHSVLLKATGQHGRRETAVLCRGLEKNGMVREWHGRGMASVNQTQPHCENQMGKTQSKPLAARHAMCESAFILHLAWSISLATAELAILQFLLT